MSGGSPLWWVEPKVMSFGPRPGERDKWWSSPPFDAGCVSATSLSTLCLRTYSQKSLEKSCVYLPFKSLKYMGETQTNLSLSFQTLNQPPRPCRTPRASLTSSARIGQWLPSSWCHRREVELNRKRWWHSLQPFGFIVGQTCHHQLFMSSLYYYVITLFYS